MQKINCPNCNLEYDLPDEWHGKKVKCNECDHIFVAETFVQIDNVTAYKYFFTGCLSFLVAGLCLYVLLKSYSMLSHIPILYAPALLWIGGSLNFVFSGLLCISIGLKKSKINGHSRRMYLFLNVSYGLVFLLFWILNHATKSPEKVSSAVVVLIMWIWIGYVFLSSIAVMAVVIYIKSTKSTSA